MTKSKGYCYICCRPVGKCAHTNPKIESKQYANYFIKKGKGK